MGTVLMIFYFSERITPPASPPGKGAVKIVKTFNIHPGKKKYVEFYFSRSTVLVIFSFFRTDNDVVCTPSFYSGIPQTQLRT